MEVLGYQYNMTFYCANGDLPTLGCNTTGTSPFTSTNEEMNALTPPEGRQCQVTDEIDGTFVTGYFSLSTAYPHAKVSDSVSNYSSASLSWRSTATEVEAALEAVTDLGGERVFGDVSIDRHAYWPPGTYKWSGQYNWSVTFDSRPGNIPQMQSNSSLLSSAGSGTGIALVETARDGNEIDGSFGLSFCPNGEDCVTTNASHFGAFLTASEMAHKFSQAFFTRGVVELNVTSSGASNEVRMRNANSDDGLRVSDWIVIGDHYYTVDGVTEDFGGQDYPFVVTLGGDLVAADALYNAVFGEMAVSVTRSSATQAMGYSWEVTFSNKTVGGDQPDISSASDTLTGSGVDITIDELHQGNQLTGTFTLSYNGETSSEIPYDASAASVQSAINSLSSVYPSRVDVTRSDETADKSQQVGGYTWTVVFDSSTWHDPTDHSVSETYRDGSWVGNPADWQDTWPDSGQGRFSKAWGRNVGFLPDMLCSSDGLGTTREDGSEDCKVGCLSRQ